MNLIFYRKAMVVHLGEDLRQLQDHSSCKVSAHQPWSRLSKLSADYSLHIFMKESINSCWGLQSARLCAHAGVHLYSEIEGIITRDVLVI